MSAYIVDHDHIDALLSFAIQHEARYTAHNGSAIQISKENATYTGGILLKENERSVRQRYPNGTMGQPSDSYTFRRWPTPLPALTILKACDGLDYQCCETDDYETSLAANIINAIRKCAISHLPGYLEAPGWALSRPAAA